MPAGYTREPAFLFGGAVVLALCVLALAHALRRVELVLEERGDLRVHTTGLLGADEWTVPPRGFDALLVEPSGEVTLRWRPGVGEAYERRFVFHTTAGLDELTADLQAATEALRALAARRAS